MTPNVTATTAPKPAPSSDLSYYDQGMFRPVVVVVVSGPLRLPSFLFTLLLVVVGGVLLVEHHHRWIYSSNSHVR